MTFLMAYWYDKLSAKAEQEFFGNWRQKVLADVTGDVLEIGAGTGANILCYPNTVNRLVLSEPDKHMRKQLLQKIPVLNLANVTVVDWSAENLAAEDGSFDFVTSSLVCCSVKDLNQCLSKVKRVLKPGGTFTFIEHIGDIDGSKRRKWQNRITPIWKKCFGNCHLNRETEQAILAQGMEIIQIDREEMKVGPSFVRLTIRGFAKKSEHRLYLTKSL